MRAGGESPASPPPEVSLVGSASPAAPTTPTGPPGGKPAGRPTHIRSREDERVSRSLRRENETALILADHGYQVRQNPSLQEVAVARAAAADTGKVGSKPDYLIEGRVFDCYAPKHPRSVRNMWSEVAEKVEDGQTQRVVLNLQDWGNDLVSVRKQFTDWPIEKLKELMAVTPDGRIVEIWHPGKVG